MSSPSALNVFSLVSQHSYALGFAALPFALDTIYSKKDYFGAWYSSIYVGWVLLALLMMLCGAVGVRWTQNSKMQCNFFYSKKYSASYLWFLSMILYILAKFLFYPSACGYYTGILLLVLIVNLVFPMSKVTIDITKKYFYILLLFTIAISISLIFIDSEIVITPHDMRWAGAIGINAKRFSGIFIGPGAFGLICALVLAQLSVKTRPTFFNWLAYSIALVGLFCSDSRSAFLSIGFFSAILLFQAKSFNLQFPILNIFASFFYFLCIIKSGAISGGSHRLEIYRYAISGASQLSASHAHNLILDELLYLPWIVSVISCITLLLMFYVALRSLIFGFSSILSYCLPLLIFSMLELGFTWDRFNIGMCSIIISILLFGLTNQNKKYDFS